MRTLRAWVARCRAAFDADRVDHELARELEDHLDRHIEERCRAGLAPAQARREALKTLGGVDVVTEGHRDRRRLPGLEHVVQDAGYALRTMRGNPGLTVVLITVISLGIGANTSIFSIVNSVVLRPLPVREPQRLVVVTDGVSPNQLWSYAVWEEIRGRAQDFANASAWALHRFTLTDSPQAQSVDGVFVSGGFFATLGVPAAIGRTLSPLDDRRGGGADGPVAVISHAFWQRYFGGAANAIGATLHIDHVPFTVIGVTAPAFSGLEVGRSFDVAVPIGTEPLLRPADLHDGDALNTALDNRMNWWLNVMLRLGPGQSLEAATAALRRAQPQLGPVTLTPIDRGTSVLRRQYEQPLWLVLALVAIVLVIACANLTNLLLARVTARHHELTVRRALGASRWRLAQQFLVESTVLCLAGAAGGMLIARWTSRALVVRLSTSLDPVVLPLAFDGRVLAFTIAATTVTIVLCGLLPALSTTRIAPAQALNPRAPRLPRRGRLGAAGGLIVGQVALSFVLLAAAGLFTRTLTRLAGDPLGFDADRVLVVGINASHTEASRSRSLLLFQQLLDAVGRVPGVRHAAVSVTTPLSGSVWGGNQVVVAGMPPSTGPESRALVNFVSPGWFETYGTRVVDGRDISRQDTETSQRVAVVNQAFVRTFFPDGRPLGRGVSQLPSVEPLVIVGVVDDAVYGSLRRRARPTMYIPLSQYYFETPLLGVSVSVQAIDRSPASLAPGLATALQQVDSHLLLTFTPLAEQVAAAMSQERLVAQLTGWFGVLAMLLAAVGIYGVASQAMGRRRREIGIRLALGARPARAAAPAVSTVLMLVGAGITLGIVVSLWTAPLVGRLLYRVEPRDPSSLATAAVLLAAVGIAAAAWPGWRAIRLRPSDVLRES